VFLWFVIVAPVIVAEVFRSPMIDYRMVALGAVLPVAEAALGGPRFLHTLLASVLALTVVMAATPRRRLVRRRLLCVPIGMFLHLVLDGTWTDQRVLWWPGFGLSFGADQVPELARGLVVGVMLEAVAVAVGVWAFRRYRLDVPENRELLRRTGQLARSTLG
jgi:hypothetical protein